MRNRTVQSVLARRHMFNNGGMVPPTPKASGILASSPSLVDAVSNDALSDMGGGTLSMAQGGAAVNMQPSYVFNQGGIAKFNPGGAAVSIPLNPSIPQGGGEVLLDDRSEIDIMRDRGDWLFKAMQERKKQTDPLRKEGDFLSRLYDKFYAPARLKGERDKARLAKEAERQAGMTEIEEMPVTVFLSQIGAPDDVIEFYSDTGNLPPGYKEAFEKAQGGGTLEGYIKASPARGSGKPVAASVALPSTDASEASDMVAGQGSVGEGFTPEETILDPTRMDASNFQGMVTDTSYVGPNKRDDQEQEGGLAEGKEEMPREGTESVVPSTGGTGGTEPPASGLAEGEEMMPDPNVVDPNQKISSEDKTEAQTQADIIAKVFEEKKVDKKGQERPKTKEEYIKDFKEGMPEYKGMSEEEAGFAIAEAGLRVMAGKSPDAIQNISEGLKGVTAEFVKDKKAKRAFDQQIDLSAVKYSLSQVNKDRDRAIAFETKEKDLVYTVNPKTGEMKTVTKADLRAGNIASGFLPSSNPLGDYIKSVKATKDLINAQTAKSKKGEITSKWAGIGEKYTQNAQKVLDSVQSKNLLGPAIEILYDPDVSLTGVEGVMTRSWNRLKNAFNLKDDYATKKGEKQEEYVSRVSQVIAKKITAILGESNRTISTPDRTRADDIAGVFADYLWDPTLKDPDILKQKIKNLWTTLENDEKLGRAEMNRITDTVGDLTTPGGKKLYSDVLRSSGQTILGSAMGIGPKGKIKKLSDFGSFNAQGIFK